MGKISLAAARAVEGSDYPAPFDAPCGGCMRLLLSDSAGLTQFGVNLKRLAPGGWSSQRHWHTTEDEFVWIVSGEVVLVTDEGEQLLRAGECAGFKGGETSGHHLQNRSTVEATLLEIGSRCPDQDVVHYPDIDLRFSAATGDVHRDGTPY